MTLQLLLKDDGSPSGKGSMGGRRRRSTVEGGPPVAKIDSFLISPSFSFSSSEFPSSVIKLSRHGERQREAGHSGARL